MQASLTSRIPFWHRYRGIAAAGTAALLLGAVALAPFSVSLPASDEGSVAAQLMRHQGMTAASAQTQESNYDVPLSEEAAAATEAPPSDALYTLDQFLFSGVVNWSGYKFTFYSEQVLPGGGLAIPGRHLNAGGYVSDDAGFIVLAGSAPKGTVYETPFGYPGKIYDRGTVGNHLDVYIR